MLDPLAALLITFLVMSAVSLVGIVLLHLIKNEKVQKMIFYFLAIWGILVAVCNVMTVPHEWVTDMILAIAFGVFGIVAVLLQLCMKTERGFKIAKILVTISVVAGMIDCFLV